MKLLELKRVKKSYSKDIRILNEINLEIESGQNVALVGPSGSGKSTLITVAAGLSDPDSGEVMVGGRSWSSMNEKQRSLHRRSHLGIVFQNFELIETLTAEENVSVPLVFADKSSESAKKALERVGLSHRLNHLPGKLSGGEKQRVGVARALVLSPGLIIADEPTGNLDKKNSDAVFELLLKTDAALLVVTHDKSLASKCDKVYSLVDGQLELE